MKIGENICVIYLTRYLDIVHGLYILYICVYVYAYQKRSQDLNA